MLAEIGALDAIGCCRYLTFAYHIDVHVSPKSLMHIRADDMDELPSCRMDQAFTWSVGLDLSRLRFRISVSRCSVGTSSF